MAIIDDMVAEMAKVAQDQQDAAFFGPPSPEESDIARWSRYRAMSPARSEATLIAESYAGLMREHGFDPDEGDACYVDLALTLFWPKDVKPLLPEWLRELPFPGGDIGAYFVKLGHVLDFHAASETIDAAQADIRKMLPPHRNQ